VGGVGCQRRLGADPPLLAENKGYKIGRIRAQGAPETIGEKNGRGGTIPRNERANTESEKKGIGRKDYLNFPGESDAGLGRAGEIRPLTRRRTVGYGSGKKQSRRVDPSRSRTAEAARSTVGRKALQKSLSFFATQRTEKQMNYG